MQLFGFAIIRTAQLKALNTEIEYNHKAMTEYITRVQAAEFRVRQRNSKLQAATKVAEFLINEFRGRTSAVSAGYVSLDAIDKHTSACIERCINNLQREGFTVRPKSKSYFSMIEIDC